MSVDLNPYAPPPDDSTFVRAPEAWVRGRVWRSGMDLIIGNDAELRPRCFKTGVDTDVALQISTTWLPKWVYWLLPLGIIPFLAVAPFFRRYIELKVPLAPELVRKHRRSQRLAAVAVSVCAVVLIAAQGAALGGEGFPLVTFFLLVASSIVYVFTRRPLRLHIVRADSSVLVLRKVHPRCLEDLPPYYPGRVPAAIDPDRTADSWPSA